MRTAPGCAGRAPSDRRGFTLVELLVGMATMAVLSMGIVGLLQIVLRAEAVLDERSDLSERAHDTMFRLVSQIKSTSYLLVPNGRRQFSYTLAYSANTNDDGDYFGGDIFFPLFDEDLPNDMDKNGYPGIRYIDENGDGWDDWGNTERDDDEDMGYGEDKVDGIDNDGDYSIDEDVPHDNNYDGAPGWRNYDDDRDLLYDEGHEWDDDEDGQIDEDPINPVVCYRSGSGDVLVSYRDWPNGAADTLCTDVSNFMMMYHEANASRQPYVTLSLTLSRDGESVTVYEAVHLENLMQRCGKRLR